MALIKVYKKDSSVIVIKQGWSWPAFFFSWIWAFTKGLMMPAVVGLVGSIICVLIHVNSAIIPFTVILSIIFGIKGNKWWADKLINNGFVTDYPQAIYKPKL